ncbi:MAG: DUF4835 family protein [Saprospiraceae bacterium]
MLRTLLVLLLALPFLLTAQQGPFNVNVKTNTQKIQTLDPEIFETMANSVRDFIAGTVWTEDAFETEEKIDLDLFLTVQEEGDDNTYTVELTIQTTRPIYGSDQKTTVFNFQDPRFSFSYQQFEPIQMSETGYAGNISSVIGFYCYMALGLDYDTFSPLGGQPYYEKAQDLYNRLPTNLQNGDNGWKQATRRNRYWMMENMLSPRMIPLRRALYTYHRKGLDLMTSDVNAGLQAIELAVQDVRQSNASYPNSVAVQMFLAAKHDEVISIFKGAGPTEQQNVRAAMTEIDPARASDYRAIR